MISEPEADAGWTTTEVTGSADGPPGSPAQDRAVDLAGGPGSVGRGASRGGRWVWALGGAVVASALWAGSLYALGDRLDAPPVAYALPEKLCDAVTAKALTAAVGDLRKDAPTSMKSEHPALDWGMCSLSTAEPNDGSGTKYGSFNVWATVQLHKKTDPEPEFDVEHPWERGAVSMERAAVQDLGERAVMTPANDGMGPELKVLDGGAVFVLTLSPFGNDPRQVGGSGRVDYTPIEAAMISDMRDLMAAMKK
ncbi:hypothetical protein ACIBEA_12240 [Streptomyces sp. NPDC051555]|uniref:hypothetical protein n=1 Tax=Streptomyces sp. NPDC051555 TaxID=3365657 RepID=UPI0037A42D35